MRLSPGAAIALVRGAGFEPAEPYPGGVDKPWLCICQQCQEVSPKTITNIHARKGCKHCLGVVIDPVKAVEEMRVADLEPLVDYPGANTAWPCSCLKCGFTEAAPTLWSVRKGVRCRACRGQVPDLGKVALELEGAGFIAVSPYPGVDKAWQLKCLTCEASASQSLSSIRAGVRCATCTEKQRTGRRWAWMRKSDLEPLVPYPGWQEPWPSRCMTCRMPNNLSLALVRQGTRCVYCSGSRINPNHAAAEMRAANAEPIAPFPGTDMPWSCRCLRCGRNITPMLANVRRKQGACGFCSRRIVDPSDAVAVMRQALLEPQTDYPGASAKWTCRCMSCGNTVSPTFNSVSGRGSLASTAR